MDDHSSHMFLLWRQNCTIRGFFWAKIASMPGGFLIKQRCCWFLPEKNEQDDRIDCDAQRLILRLSVPTEIFFQDKFFLNLLVPVSFKIWKIFVIWKMDFLLGWREFNTEGFVDLSNSYFFSGKCFSPWWSLCCQGNIGEVSVWSTSEWEECCQRFPHTSPEY